ncbi:MAG: hypothetical protein OXE96_10855 [Gemmatimonadetes bacterium]|nr:hypothetical protein [Gemmatimonadota bacterium]
MRVETRGCLAFLGLAAALTMACASGGGGPAVTGEEAAALFAAYSGRWELDETSSSAQIPNQLEGVKDEVPVADVARNESREMRRYRRMVEARRMSVSHMRTTIEVLRRRPETLVIRAEEAELSYTPLPGTTIVLPMDGTQVEVREGEHRIRSEVRWDGAVLQIDHVVVSGGRVRERLEVVGDRMIMTRVIVASGPGEPLVLAYDRS